jgi:activator of 2-hydroxyglutaryl-CoA dehydratase
MERLCAGVNNSMVQRMLPMLIPFTGHRLLVSGGAAQNKAIIQLLNKHFGPAEVLIDPQFNGAIGCCIYGEKHIVASHHVMTP